MQIPQPKPFGRQRRWVGFLLLAAFTTVLCQLRPDDTWVSPLPLADFTENGVRVVVELERDANGDTLLAATFTPTEADFHVYSKDLPRDGVEGLGRPTLLELPPHAQMLAQGDLLESVLSVEETFGADEPPLPIYPAGPVTLRLPVALPQADTPWVADEVSLTFMACSQSGCRPPVVEKVVAVQVPSQPADNPP